MAPRFDPDRIHEAALLGVGLPRPRQFAAVIEGLEQRYPGQIDAGQPWIFSNAGGVMIQLKLLYASLTEYVALFGTPVGTGGHSGRLWAEFHDTVLDGEASYYHEGEFEKTVYTPGQRIFVAPFKSAGMQFTDRFWALEYCRGVLPTMLPFGLADALLSTLDLPTVWRTLRVYSALVLRSIRR